jgi:hypothetical protein
MGFCLNEITISCGTPACIGGALLVQSAFKDKDVAASTAKAPAAKAWRYNRVMCWDFMSILLVGFISILE